MPSLFFEEDAEGFHTLFDVRGKYRPPLVGTRILAQLNQGTVVGGRPVMQGFRVFAEVTDTDRIWLPLYRCRLRIGCIYRLKEVDDDFR